MMNSSLPSARIGARVSIFSLIAGISMVSFLVGLVPEKSFAQNKSASSEANSAQVLNLSLTDSLTVSTSAVKRLKEMRAAFEKGDFDLCLKRAAPAKKAAKSLEPWILALELECAQKLPNVKATSEKLNRVLVEADRRRDQMVYGPWASRLRSAWAGARLYAIEVDTKFNRPRAWTHFEKLSSAVTTMTGGALLDEAGRAKLWRMAGELLFLVRKNEAAREFFRRSLAEQDQPDLRDRARLLGPAESGDTSPISAPLPTVKQPDGSAAEIELAERISNQLKSGDLVAAAEDAMKLMQDFPGSPRAKWAADRTQESLISVSEKSGNEKSGEKFLPVRESLLKIMEKGDADRTADWARALFNRGLWADSARLGRSAGERQSPGRATKTLELALDAAYAIDDFKSVKSIGNELMEKHAGTASARTAALRVGLLAYRQQDYAKAASVFERLVATPSTETLELQARYWLWRALQKSGSERAKTEGEELALRYPFSYYGLRARIEGAGGTLDWLKENPKQDSKLDKVTAKIWVTQEEKMGYDRSLILASSGWFDEAQSELSLLPTPITPDQKAIMARIWGAAKNYLAASQLANQAWDVKFELRRPDLMDVVWPSEYKGMFETYAKARGLDPVLTRSLTKQESGYNKRAVSTSNALGLMQMIPPTAREIADDLKMGKLSLPEDMFEPDRNIRMGTHYVAKMMNQFKGHVPLALAAYNAGPTRVDRWLKARSSLQGLESTRVSTPESELWIDEFPFAETSFYVKAILRNLMMYQITDSGRFTTQEPLWKASAGVARP